jgi:CBS domain-containing protein
MRQEKFMNVSEIMAKPFITATPDAALESIATLLRDRHIGCVPIVDESERLCGLFTESDFSAEEQGVPFSTRKLPALFKKLVAESDEIPIGIVTRRDPLRLRARNLGAERS